MPAGRNIYEQQAANRRGTVIVMAAFILVVGLLGLGLDVFLLGFDPGAAPDGGGIPIPVASPIAALLASFSAVSSYFAGDTTVLRSAGAAAVAPADPRARQLSNVVEEIAIAAGQPVPRLYLIPDPDPNAFATGRDPAHASIAVTDGLLERLSRDELQGVVAHEMSHIRNHDIRLMTVVAALIGAVMLIAEFGLRTFGIRGGKRSEKGSGRSAGGGVLLLALWLLALILAPLISQLLAMAVSRKREFLADAGAAELTRNPGALASALEKIDGATDPTRAIKKGTAHLCIADPLGRSANEREGIFADLLATHPPVRTRVSLLRAMAYQPA